MMSQAEKKMKRYVNAIERRLNLPLEVRSRVMSDFSSSITARREAGKSDAEIYAELGEPKKVAADLNEQMKEFAYRKSPWRYLFILLSACAGIHLLRQLAVVIVTLGVVLHTEVQSASSIGIIGGADGPTAIFITADWSGLLLEIALAAAAALLCLMGYRRLCRCRKK